MLNKVILMGRLTREPELRTTQSGTSVVNFSLAVDRGYRAAEGQQTVDFINIVAWKGTAEFVSKWFRKGQLVAVSGRIQARTWVSDNGENRTSTEVVANEVFFAEPKRDGQQSNSEITPLPFPVSNSEYTDIEFEELPPLPNDGEFPF
jgi:single-strand DNA-binding protein